MGFMYQSAHKICFVGSHDCISQMIWQKGKTYVKMKTEVKAMNTHKARLLDVIINTAEKLKQDIGRFDEGLDCISIALKELYKELEEENGTAE